MFQKCWIAYLGVLGLLFQLHSKPRESIKIETNYTNAMKTNSFDNPAISHWLLTTQTPCMKSLNFTSPLRLLTRTVLFFAQNLHEFLSSAQKWPQKRRMISDGHTLRNKKYFSWNYIVYFHVDEAVALLPSQ